MSSEMYGGLLLHQEMFDFLILVLGINEEMYDGHLLLGVGDELYNDLDDV